MNLARVSKALAAFAGALPVTVITAAVAGHDWPGFVIAVLGAVAVAAGVYLAPANAPPPAHAAPAGKAGP